MQKTKADAQILRNQSQSLFTYQAAAVGARGVGGGVAAGVRNTTGEKCGK